MPARPAVSIQAVARGPTLESRKAGLKWSASATLAPGAGQEGLELGLARLTRLHDGGVGAALAHEVAAAVDVEHAGRALFNTRGLALQLLDPAHEFGRIGDAQQHHGLALEAHIVDQTQAQLGTRGPMPCQPSALRGFEVDHLGQGVGR
jgi:hypothetical protein